jgi:hypothetical protein
VYAKQLSRKKKWLGRILCFWFLSCDLQNNSKFLPEQYIPEDECGLNSPGSGQGPAAGTCGHGKEILTLATVKDIQLKVSHVA